MIFLRLYLSEHIRSKADAATRDRFLQILLMLVAPDQALMCLVNEQSKAQGSLDREYGFGSKGSEVSLVVFLAFLQSSSFEAHTLPRIYGRLPVSILEVSVVVHIICISFIHLIAPSLPKRNGIAIPLKLENNDPSGNTGSSDDTWIVGKNTNLVFGVLSAIHTITWASPCPTPEEKWAWRVAASCAYGLNLFLVFSERKGQLGNHNRTWDLKLKSFFIFTRLTLVVLAVTTFRNLPADTFRLVPWAKFIPRILS